MGPSQQIFSETPRSARVEVVLKDGQTLSHFTPQPLGSWQNPMSIEDVNTKARDLLEPVLGPARTEEIISRVNGLETVDNVQELLPFLTLSSQEMASVSYGH